MIHTSIEPDFDPTSGDVFFTARAQLRDGDGALISEALILCDNAEQAEGILPQLVERLGVANEPTNAARNLAVLLQVLGVPAGVPELAHRTGARLSEVESGLNALRLAGLARMEPDGVWHALYPAGHDAGIVPHLLIALTTIAALTALVLIDLGWLA